MTAKAVLEFRPPDSGSLQFGPLHLDAHFVDESLVVSTEHRGEYRNVTVLRAADEQHFLGRHLSKSVRAIAALPDRSVLIRPDEFFTLLPGARTTVYTYVPLFLRIQDSEARTVTEIPSRILSDTWFGNYQAGELCYAFSSRLATERLAAGTAEDAVALCPLRIRNKAEKPLVIRTLCIRVRWLGLFYGAEGYQTNEMLITYRGEEHASELHVASQAPEGTELVAAPREVAPRSLSIKTFVSLLKGESV